MDVDRGKEQLGMCLSSSNRLRRQDTKIEKKFPRPLILGMSSDLAHHHFFHTSLAKAKYTASSYSRGILQLSISR